MVVLNLGVVLFEGVIFMVGGVDGVDIGGVLYLIFFVFVGGEVMVDVSVLVLVLVVFGEKMLLLKLFMGGDGFVLVMVVLLVFLMNIYVFDLMFVCVEIGWG